MEKPPSDLITSDQYDGACRGLEHCLKWMQCKLCHRVFSSPVQLECQHTFCRRCLLDYQKDTQTQQLPCPICKRETVPLRNEISGQSTNRLVSDIVHVIRRHAQEKAEEQNPDTRMAPAPSVVESKSQPEPSKNTNNQKAASRAHGHAVRELDVDSGVLIDSTPEIVMPDVLWPETDEPVHREVCCNNCELKHIIGHRYCCGVCTDYNLCQTCFGQSTEIHDAKHVFVLLKQPQTNKDAPKPIFHKLEYMRLQLSFVLGTKLHDVTCDKCQSTTIEGTRYKCGLCPDYDLCPSCFLHCERFHPKTHTFLVLHYDSGYHNIQPYQKSSFY